MSGPRDILKAFAVKFARRLSDGRIEWPPEVVFALKDTYGLPLEYMEQRLAEAGMCFNAEHVQQAFDLKANKSRGGKA